MQTFTHMYKTARKIKGDAYATIIGHSAVKFGLDYWE